MNSGYTVEQIKTYAAKFRVGDAIRAEKSGWLEVLDVGTIKGVRDGRLTTRSKYNSANINYGNDGASWGKRDYTPILLGFHEDGKGEDNFLVTSLREYRTFQGGENIVWLGESDRIRTFGKTYKVSETLSYTGDDGRTYVTSLQDLKWGVIPRFEHVSQRSTREDAPLDEEPQKVEVSFDEMAIQTEIITRLLKQTAKGVKKYGEPVQHGNLTAIEWIDHAIDESIDQITYLTALKHSLQDKEGK